MSNWAGMPRIMAFFNAAHIYRRGAPMLDQDGGVRVNPISREERWRDLICRVEGVNSARVIFGKDGEPKEIHVVAHDQRHPKQLIRDIQSVLMATFEVEVDYRIISVARLPAEDMAQPPMRLKYGGMDIHTSLNKQSATVRLIGKDNESTGQSTVGFGMFARVRMVAQATVEAINAYAGEPLFELIEVSQSHVAGRLVVLVALHYAPQDNLLLGSAYVGEDVDRASVKAVLNGANRRLEGHPKKA